MGARFGIQSSLLIRDNCKVFPQRMPNKKPLIKRKQETSAVKSDVSQTALSTVFSGPTPITVTPSMSACVSNIPPISPSASKNKLCLDSSIVSEKGRNGEMDIVRESQGQRILKPSGLKLALNKAAVFNIP